MKINKCLFCGSNSTATMEVDRNYTGTHRFASSFSVECFDCGARGSKADNRKTSIKLWNNIKKGTNE